MNITAEQLGGLLEGIKHEHPLNGCDIYYETDLYKLFEAIGLPAPVYAEPITLEDFKENNESQD